MFFTFRKLGSMAFWCSAVAMLCENIWMCSKCKRSQSSGIAKFLSVQGEES
jgi:hypothetical protein